MSIEDLRDADLRGADLRDADLAGANLRGADLRDADLAGANLRDANLREADLAGANLREADLAGAKLRDANLRGANIDFASWPLWCGSKDVITDDRQKIQLLAHVAVLAGDITDPDLAELLRSALFRRVAAKCHRAAELGLTVGDEGGEP